MSVQFGKCNFDGRPVASQDLDEVRPVLAPYGPDAEGFICEDNFAILYRAFYTTKEAQRETQPHVTPSGFILTWDGRLDNREELIGQLSKDLSSESTDLEIVAAAYQHWATNAFAKLIGDWALSVWNPKARTLVLAKDFLGTRHLYYMIENGQVTWCTILDALVLSARRTFKLEQEYVAGWLASFPAPHLTPYVGIHSLPPSSFICLTGRTQSLNKYWDFDPKKKIRYVTDAEYEEQFRVVFSEAVRRRLRADGPVLAELSGGMDSSSIVCTADHIAAQGFSGGVRLDTVSYYDDDEPAWDERPYFTKIEQKRGRSGCHIVVSSETLFNLDIGDHFLAAIPRMTEHCTEAAGQFAVCLSTQGNRVVLSGTGGDETMGGVPTSIPEIADLLARPQLGNLAHQLKMWALTQRKPWMSVLFEAVRGFLPFAPANIPKHKLPASWLDPRFVRRFQRALTGYESRLKLFGPLPSFQINMFALEFLRRELACCAVCAGALHEKRYPYLDRTLLEFIYAIPREQLVRPGNRRSLMRRALVGIVPEEILQRRRKAFISRSPILAISGQASRLVEMNRAMASGSFRIVDVGAFCEALQAVRTGLNVPLVALIRTLEVELWIRQAVSHGKLMRPSPPMLLDATATRITSC